MASDTQREKSNDLINELTVRKDQFQRSARKWKVCYRVLVVSSVTFSAFATVFANIEFPITASVLAALAGISTTVIGTLEFEQNWKANRKARLKTDSLYIDLMAGEKSEGEIYKDLKQIIDDAAKSDTGED